MKKIYLASSSPRRRELLEKAQIPFHNFPVKVSEFLNKNLNLDEAVKNIARTKAYAARDEAKILKLFNILILSADTVVVLDDEVLGKPENFDEACAFLRRLSGREHEVKTAVCVLDFSSNEREICEIESSFVKFRNLSEFEIINYVKTGSPMDKAGAYGIQDVGRTFIENVTGELDNVMGLPVNRVKRILDEIGRS
jgi:septum formation protein